MKQQHSPTELPSSEEITIEASSWISQLDGGALSAADRLALAEWMARSPRHAAELRRLARLWGNIDHLIDTAVEAQPRKSRGSLSGTWYHQRPMIFNTIFGTALVLVLVISAFYLYPQLNITDTRAIPMVAVYNAERGEHKDIELQDRSNVHLNTNSIVEVKYTEEARTVRLLHGEALFDVQKESNRPFQVYAGTTLVEAVGTIFLVRLHEKTDDVDVTVSEGAVRLETLKHVEKQSYANSNPAASLITETVLKAGQSVRVNKDTTVIEEIDKSVIERRMAWRNGLLVFSGETLEHVVNEVARYLPQSIIIQDPELGAMEMGGVFKTGELEPLLAALQSTMGIEVNHVRSDLIYINMKK